MMVHIRKTGRGIECWVEVWDIHNDQFQIVAEAQCIMAGEDCLIDTIETRPDFRGKGYATAIVERLLSVFPRVAPIAVQRGSEGFWKKFNMADALGEY